VRATCHQGVSPFSFFAFPPCHGLRCASSAVSEQHGASKPGFLLRAAVATDSFGLSLQLHWRALDARPLRTKQSGSFLYTARPYYVCWPFCYTDAASAVVDEIAKRARRDV
jgi:hypothetical protein